MNNYQPLTVLGFHSCDKEIGLRILNGSEDLIPSDNSWDWLGEGVYFWEHDPLRALQYAEDNASGKQINKTPSKTPFVLGAIIDLGNCLNLVDAASLKVLNESHRFLSDALAYTNKTMPRNRGKNRALDCAVIKNIHQSNVQNANPEYDTVRCAFPEGEEAYPGAHITSQLHIQLCVRNSNCIKGIFLPKPIRIYNPYLIE